MQKTLLLEFVNKTCTMIHLYEYLNDNLVIEKFMLS